MSRYQIGKDLGEQKDWYSATYGYDPAGDYYYLYVEKAGGELLFSNLERPDIKDFRMTLDEIELILKEFGFDVPPGLRKELMRDRAFQEQSFLRIE